MIKFILYCASILLIIWGAYLMINDLDKYIPGTIICLIGIAAFIYAKTIGRNKRIKINMVNQFKLSSTKNEINLSDCRVLTSPYQYNAETLRLDNQYKRGFIGDLQYQREIDQLKYLNNLRLEYIIDIKGVQQIFYSANVVIDKTKILPLLELQKSTYLYLSNSDNLHYYFDIEFLYPYTHKTTQDIHTINQL